MKTNFTIVGMSCVNCANAVKAAALSVDGVKSATVSLSDDILLIEYDGESCIEAVKMAVSKAGYTACVGGSAASKREEAGLGRRLIASVSLMAVAMIIALLNALIPSFPRFLCAGEVLLIIPVMILNRHFYYGAYRALSSKRANMDVLVSVGSLCSFIYGMYLFIVTLAGGMPDFMGSNSFFESAGMILTLVSVGKYLERRARRKTGDALAGLVNLRPSRVTVVDGDSYTDKDVGELQKGDICIIRAGNNVPADGIVCRGNALLDESSVTGESVAVPKENGDEIISGTRVIKGEVYMEATAVGEDCTLMQIVRMTREAAASKAPVAGVADKVAGVFVPVVCLIAMVTFIIWLVLTKDLGSAMSHAISVIVISCPCSLGLATPLAITVGMGEGARRGILFKSAESLEKLSKTDVVLFDKTGTVTTGDVSADGEVSSDNIREGAPETVAYLRAKGIKTVLLTGDKEMRAKSVAQSLAVDEYRCNLLPGDKLNALNEYKRNAKCAVMIGDGVNDAPALTGADVGIALGSGRDVAIESADVVLMHSNPADVARMMELSIRTFTIIKENLFWAFFYNMLGIPIAAGAFYAFNIELNPAVSAACMSLSSLCVVMNSLRLKRIKSGGPAVNPKEENKMIIEVEGMMCEHCAKRVTDACLSVAGVENAAVNLKEKNVTVTAGPDVSESDVRKAILDAGYMLK